MRSVSIIGIGETKFGKYPEKSLRDLINEAGEEAIKDANIEKERIQALYLGNFAGQQLARQGFMSALASETLGLGDIPHVRTEGACCSGSLALRMAQMAVGCGAYDVVLVGGVEKMTHQPTGIVTDAIASAMDSINEVPYGSTFPGQFAQIANRYFYEYRNVKKEMAMVAVNAHKNGALNPDAQMQKEISLDKVLDAAMIADPLSLYDCSLVTDGAVFIVVAATVVVAAVAADGVVVGGGGSVVVVVVAAVVVVVAGAVVLTV